MMFFKNNWTRVLFFSLLSQSVFAVPIIVEQDFASLFNRFRVAQPTHVPWAGSFYTYADNGTAVGVVNGYAQKGLGSNSPIHLYDQMFNPDSSAYNFEMKNHSCDGLSDYDREACRAWWGHCNGWTAAAIREIEPRQSLQLRGQTLEVGHQKGILAELWLNTFSGFLGSTRKERRTGDWVYDQDDPDYRSFWDVTPHETVLGLMNQVGAMGVGIALDRFTGDQVWNHPLVGYRILPIRADDLGSQVFNGQTFYFARLRMKLFWAGDNVHPGHLSSGFDIQNTTDSEQADVLNGDYDQRLLKFKLFFNAPVVTDPTGTQVLSAGVLIGDGLWEAQEFPEDNSLFLNEGHPDFLWNPESPYVDYYKGYGNPYLKIENVKEMSDAARGLAQASVPARIPSAARSMASFKVQVNPGHFKSMDPAQALGRIFSRSGLPVVLTSSVSQPAADRWGFRLQSNGAMPAEQIREAFADAGLTEIQIESIKQ